MQPKQRLMVENEVEATQPVDQSAQPQATAAAPAGIETEILKREVARLTGEVERVYQNFLRERLRVQQLEQALESHPAVSKVRQELRSISEKLVREVQYLKKVYPLHALLAAKESELKMMKENLRRIPPHHPERPVFEMLVKSHIRHRDEVRELVERTQEQFDAQIGRVQMAADARVELMVDPIVEPTHEPSSVQPPEFRKYR